MADVMISVWGNLTKPVKNISGSYQKTKFKKVYFKNINITHCEVEGAILTTAIIYTSFIIVNIIMLNKYITAVKWCWFKIK